MSKRAQSKVVAKVAPGALDILRSNLALQPAAGASPGHGARSSPSAARTTARAPTDCVASRVEVNVRRARIFLLRTDAPTAHVLLHEQRSGDMADDLEQDGSPHHRQCRF